ncbi:MAG: site-specific integrase, partial [Phycisphaerae bacterium]|nr:site-specific integrase [Phycisphaerae bacterium]
RIEAIKPHVSGQVWAMVQLQLYTAARAGEICRMRPCDVDRDGKVWLYQPSDHKTAYRGHERSIYIGPRAQRVLAPFLLRDPRSYCFSPAEADDQRRRILSENRTTPLSCGNTPGSNVADAPRWTAGQRYTTGSYRRAIQRGCDRAFPPPERLARRDGETKAAWQRRLTDEQKAELKAWRKAHRWHPHQLRHNAATELRKEFGLETARIILGHRSPAVTTIYAEQDRQKALDAMEKVG